MYAVATQHPAIWRGCRTRRPAGCHSGGLVEFRLGLDQILGRQGRLRLGVERGLVVVERGLERQPHLHAAGRDNATGEESRRPLVR